MIATIKLALQLLRRDLRAGELTLLVIALALAVASLTSVAFLTERVEQSLRLQSHQLLGGDLLLTADHPWPQAQRNRAAAMQIKLAETTSFPSMVSSLRAENSGTLLADIKAVSAGYPLRGVLKVATEDRKTDKAVRGIPARGEAWGDARLFSDLGLKRGDRVAVGGVHLVIKEMLVVEPDRGFNVLGLAPRLMINVEDLAATGLLQEGSRVQWRLHLAGEATAIKRYQQWAKITLGRGEKIENLDNARPEVRTLLDRAQRFFSLAAMLSVVLAAVAITLTVNRYVRRHLDGCAVMRCLGASNRVVLGVHLGEFALSGLAATVVGCLAGFLIQHGLVTRLSGLIATDLPAPTWRPWVLGLGVGMLMMAGSVLPPLLRLRNVPAVAVLRREWNSDQSWRVWPVWLAGIGALALLMLWIANDLTLGFIVIGGFAAIGAVYSGLTLLLLTVLGRFATSAGGWAGFRRGLAGLHRRRQTTLIQTVALAVGMTTLLLLTVGRADLLAAWKHRVPPDAPNRFVINIQPDQREAINAFFRDQQATAPLLPTLEPMIRGRLTAINGQAITALGMDDDRARRLVEREFNLSWTAQLQIGNAVVAGQWHADSAQPEFSVEQGIANDLGLKLGDELRYDIAGSSVSAPITSIRKLEWDSMQVNFFVVGTPGLLENQPASYITSFHLAPGREGVVTALVRSFPNLTVIDVASLVRQLEAATDQAARAVEAVFGFALVAGVIVLVAVFNTTHDERIREMAIMRALGARRGQMRATLIVESVTLGSLAGLLASIGAGTLSFALARWVFKLPYVPGPMLPLIAVVAGILLAGIGGYIGLRRIANVSPVRVLASDAA